MSHSTLRKKDTGDRVPTGESSGQFARHIRPGAAPPFGDQDPETISKRFKKAEREAGCHLTGREFITFEADAGRLDDGAWQAVLDMCHRREDRFAKADIGFHYPELAEFVARGSCEDIALAKREAQEFSESPLASEWPEFAEVAAEFGRRA